MTTTRDIDAMSDDEAIACALLSGCEFYQVLGKAGYYVDSNSFLPRHPLEEYRRVCHENNIYTPWPTKAELARDYLNWLLQEATPC